MSFISFSTLKKNFAANSGHSGVKFLHNIVSIDPFFLTGFVDAEGCFSISVYQHDTARLGWRAELGFVIGLHEKDAVLLESIRDTLGAGRIHKLGSNSLLLRIEKIDDLQKIVDHFDEYPLLSAKAADFSLFREAFYIIKSKGHLTSEGLEKLVEIKASMNLGLSDKLKNAFPLVTPTPRPSLALDCVINNPNWLAGFITGEGCFFINTSKKKSANKYHVRLMFIITQHKRDDTLIRSISQYLECGNIHTYKDAVYLQISKFEDLYNKLIPFIEKNPTKGDKHFNYPLEFLKAAEMIKAKEHLTEEGVSRIRLIKSKMNKREKK